MADPFVDGLRLKLAFERERNQELTHNLRIAQENERAALAFLAIFAPPDATELIQDGLTRRWIQEVGRG